MDTYRVVPVKLSVPEDRQDDLHTTIQQFNRASNYVVENHARNEEGYLILNKYEMHDRVYYALRERTDLPANLCTNAYSRVVSDFQRAVTMWRNGKKRSLPNYSGRTIEYDRRTLTIKDRSATLATINGRVSVDYILGDYQREYLDDDDYEKRTGTLRYREDEGEFYLHIFVLKEVEERDGDRVLGVDLNLKNVAVTSTGEFFDGGKLLWGKNHFFRARRSLQNKGTRSAMQTLKRLSGRENRFVLDRLHTISRRIVEEAINHNCSHIALERLTDIRDSMQSHDDRIQRQMHQWAFRELQEMIEYKAAEYGIKAKRIPPAFTSQTCSRCGHQSSTNRDRETGWFECNECGYELDGDYNAAKNIGMKLITLPEGKRPSGLGDGQLALKSGTVNANGEYSPASDGGGAGDHGQAHT